jgi:predicted ATPase
VLRNILADSEQKRKLLNLVNYLLPFVHDIHTEQVANGLLLGLQEDFLPDVNMPASLLSEGTIEAIALVVILYFSDKSIIILEEPDRHFHPFLIQRILELMEEVTTEKQIIMTTHNPQVVQYANLDHLLFMSRDKQGFSQILRPAESESVQIFMQNEIGVQDLYVRDLLGV